MFIIEIIIEDLLLYISIDGSQVFFDMYSFLCNYVRD